MSRSFALFISYLFHPALMPTVGVAAILALSPYYIPQNIYALVILYVFIGTYVLPGLLVLSLWKLKLVDSIHLKNAKERRYPFILAALFFYLTAQSVRSFPVPDIVSTYLLAGVLLLGISLALLSFTKISAHMAGIGSILGLGVYLSNTFFVQLLAIISATVLIAGLLGSARLVLKAHSSFQVYAGFSLGLTSVLAVFYFF